MSLRLSYGIGGASPRFLFEFLRKGPSRSSSRYWICVNNLVDFRAGYAIITHVRLIPPNLGDSLLCPP